LSKRSKRRCGSKALARLFGAPPILPSEDPKAYQEMVSRVATDIGPRDFIEEIWVHDLADAAWNLSRWRRIKAAYLVAKVSEQADQEAVKLAEAESGIELSQVELDLDRNSQLQKLVALLRSRLDMDSIEVDVIAWNLRFIEPIESLIATAQDRFDQIMRELHRHRFVQNQGRSSMSPEPAQVKEDEPKKIAGTLVTIVPHDQ
jgi:hypothetical protein